MNTLNLSAAVLCLALLACGPNASTPDAAAENAATAPNATTVSAAEQNAVLSAASLHADARGMVDNECGEKVAPKLIAVDLGLGRTILLAMEGGPNMASCYGDGPGLTLFKQNGAGWREIYSSRGAFMAVLQSRHQGANDLVEAGPGFSHPLFTWNGTAYVSANHSVSDEQTGNAAIYPQ